MQNIFKIVKLSKAQHKWIIVAAILITVQAALQQVTPITLKFVVDELSSEITTGEGSYDRLLFLFGIILGLNLLAVIISSVGQRLGDYIASRIRKFLTEVFYKKIFTLPQSYFDSEVSGKIVNQLARGIAAISDFINGTTNFVLPSILQALFSIIVLSYFDLTIGILSFLIYPIYILISRYSTNRWGKRQEEKNVHEDLSRGRIQEVIANIRLVKTYNTQKKEWDYVSDEYKTINKIYDKQSNEYHVLNFLREFGLELIIIVFLYIIFRKTFFGTLSLGEMVLVIQLLAQLRWPLFSMGYILEQVQHANADAKTFFDVLNLKSTEKFQTKKLQRLSKNPSVEFKNIAFSYESGVSVLKNINLKLGNNETIALVGHSGAGKTTLVNLILKLYEPTKGSIYLSGKDYSKTNHSWIRSHMTLVFQDAELFSSTIRENVAYGLDEKTDKEIVSALKQANAWEFVEKFKKQLDEEIGERGVKLSGGQKQRIQIARAILQNKPILILDEATSSLDSKSERLVQEALEKLFKNRLTIIIAHRFSTIQNADRIIVLDGGTVVDNDKPQKLANKTGLYSELLNYQIEGNKKLLSKYELH